MPLPILREGVLGREKVDSEPRVQTNLTELLLNDKPRDGIEAS